MLCQHCARRRVCRPRKLCWICYYAPGVRELYPSTSKFGRRGPGNFHRKVCLPHFPTRALPGSPEKIAILEQRAQLGQELFHPQDAAFDDTAAFPVAS